MNLDQVIQWMLNTLEKDGCLYQEDVVDYLVKNDLMDLLKENSDGNLVLKLSVNSAFKKRLKKMLFGLNLIAIGVIGLLKMNLVEKLAVKKEPPIGGFFTPIHR